jgi:hypothetical protein
MSVTVRSSPAGVAATQRAMSLQIPRPPGTAARAPSQPRSRGYSTATKWSPACRSPTNPRRAKVRFGAVAERQLLATMPGKPHFGFQARHA